MFITFPFFSLYVQELGGSVVDIGVVNSLRPLLGLLLYPIAGYLSDHYSRVKIITLTGFLGAVLWTFFIFAPDWRWLALGNFLLGFMTFYFPAANSLMAESLPNDKRALGFSLWQAIPMAAGIFSPLAGGYLISLWGVETAMRLLYGLTLIISVLISGMNFRFLRETTRDVPDNGLNMVEIIVKSYGEMFHVIRDLTRSLKAFGLMLALGFFFNSMVSSYWVVYVVKVMGFTEVQWGLVLLVASVVNVVLLLPAGIIVDRFGSKRVLTFALILGAVPIMLFPYLSSLISVVALFVIITLTNSFLMAGAPSYMAQATPEDKRGRIMSALGQGMLFVNTRGGGVGGPGMGALLVVPTIMGSLLGGFVYNYNPELLWLFYGVSLILSAAISWTFLD
jgi:DHA1 family multidrug resistance protein-like MFS transporter